jgi:MFS family permease
MAAPLPRRVWLLLFAQVASQMGDAAFCVLLLWAALGMTEDKAIVGAVAMFNYLPILLFGMVGGLAADRFPRRGLMVASDGARAAIALSVPILGTLGLLGPWTLAAAGFCLFTASAFFNPARDAYIPSLVAREDLPRANALVQVSVPMGWLFGPALCSAFLPWLSPVSLVGGVGLLFLVSVAFLMGLPGVPSARKEGARPAKAIFEGLVVAWRDVRLRWLLVITAADNLLIMGPAIVGTPILVKARYGGTGSGYALMEAALAVGVFAGLPLTSWLNRRVGQGRLLIVGIFLDGITYLPLLWIDHLWAAGITIALHGVSIPLITVTRASLVQRIAPPEQLGRVFALIGITVLGLTAASSGLTGLAATLLPMNIIFGIIAVGAALCGPAAWFSRGFRDA